MSYSAIVISWNAAETIEPCLDSVLAQELDAPLETIVVDNASSDGTAALLERYEGRARLVHNDENVGFSVAANQGAESASGNILVFLNPDIRLIGNGALQALVDAVRAPPVGLAGPRLLNPDGTLQPSAHRHPSALGALRRGRDAPSAGEVDWVMGAVLAIERELFLDVGGFWAEPYGQDEDLALKVQGRGLAVRYVPESEVVHHGNVSGRQRWAAADRAAHVARAELAILAAHYGRFEGGLIRWITLWAYLARAVLLRAVRRGDRAAIYAAMAREYRLSERAAAARDG